MNEMLRRCVRAVDSLDQTKARSMDELTEMIVRSVIKTMREPTDDMVHAVVNVGIKGQWRDMIDAVLAEKDV